MEIDYRKIIFKKNAFENVAEFVKDKQRVLIISSNEASKKYLQGLINFLNEENIDFSVFYLKHDCSVCDEVVNNVVEKASSGYSSLLSFGANTNADITKIAATRLDMNYIIVPTTISHYGYFSDVAYLQIDNSFEKIKCKQAEGVFIDEEIIRNSDMSFVFSTYAFIMSFLEHIVNMKSLEEIYNISFEKEINEISEIIKKTEGLLNWLALGNKEAVLTLMEYIVELYSVVQKSSLEVNNSIEISLLSKKVTSAKNFGRRCLFYSDVLLSIYKKFFSQKNISVIDIPNFKNLDKFIDKNKFFSEILPIYLKNSEIFLKRELFFKLRIVKSTLQKFCEKKLCQVKKVSKKITSISENFGVTKYVDEEKLFGAISTLPVLNFDSKVLGMMLRLGHLNF